MAKKYYVSKEPDSELFWMAGMSDCGKYQYWLSHVETNGWTNIIVRSVGKVKNKSKFCFAYHNTEQRYSRNRDFKTMLDHHNELMNKLHTITGWYDGI